jgi:hypothetical protein
MQKYTPYLLFLGVVMSGMQVSVAGPNGDMGMPDRAEIESALEACMSSLEADSNGRPDPSAMDSCMSAKGFSKPSGPPGGMGGHERGHPQPDRD